MQGKDCIHWEDGGEKRVVPQLTLLNLIDEGSINLLISP